MLEDPWFEAGHAVHRDADRLGELLGGDRRLGVPLVGQDGDDAGCLHQSFRVGDRIRPEGGLPRGCHRVARRLATEMRRQPPPECEGVHRGVGEPIRDRPEGGIHARRREERFPEEHRPGVEPLGPFADEIREPVRVGVRVDDLNAGQIHFGHP